LDQLADREDALIHPAALARTLGEFIGGEGLAVFDGGHTSFWSNDFTPALAPRTRLHEPGMSHLGFGLPWAMALKHTHRDQNVFCITGDGAFGFTLGELDSARRHGLNVITVIHNNASFGVIRIGQNKAGFEYGTGLEDTDYAAIARGFGCFGEKVEVLHDLVPALNRALASGLPAVIDVRVSFQPHPMLPVFGKSTAAPT
jgi:acetolactate synthase-1/2/3 large subunit